MAITVEDLVLRLEKGSPLTALEGDDNFRKLRDFSNSIAALFSVALNNDGTLKNPPIIYGASSAGTDAYAITPTPAITAAADMIGRLIVFRADVANTGAATLQVSALASAAILKFGNQPLDSNDIKAGQYVFASWDGTNFQMQSWPGVVQPVNYGVDTGAANAYVVNQLGVNQIPAAYYNGFTITFVAANANTGASTLRAGALVILDLRHTDGTALSSGDIVAGQIVTAVYSPSAYFVLTSYVKAPRVVSLGQQALPAGYGNVDFAHTFTTKPSLVRVVFVCVTAQVGYVAGDEVDISGVFYDNGGTYSTPIGYMSDATKVRVIISNNNPLTFMSNAGDAQPPMTRANWQLKVYAQK